MITMAVLSSYSSRRRGFWTAPLCLLACSLLASASVATKGDVRRLQTELATLRAQKDSLERVAARLNRALQDSLRGNTELLRHMQGQIVNQLSSVQDLILTVQQLSGQNEQRLAQLREQIEQSRQPVTPPPGAPGGAASGGDVEAMFNEGMTRLKESPAIARVVFQQIVSDHREHARAADAQFYIGETYYAEKNYDQAYRELELVAQSFPASPKAPAALMRAGAIAEERRDVARARRYYQQVQNNFPRSDEARLARQAISRLSRR
jgi:tol-pal system protein YbgF